ncbi:hypothetical protein GCM10007916_03320 [Psychromonas marina]|uniref:histidine kinase n=1 Tax=Psychromonas marina TaxID=88364 RepID=A0ABQ6DWA4_9GAMM|nr:ATP-binding protein [Psychromonas marina]GLS89265.1 hypothetical protein GCM10007916_03320 [Psychromonas marina]
MKSNLYSIFIFLIGLSATYIITKNVQQIEIKTQNRELMLHSQAITHNIQQQISQHAQQLSVAAQRWKSIEHINDNWQTEVDTLIELLPNFSNLNIYLLAKQPTLTIDSDAQRYFATLPELLQQAKHLQTLNHNQNEKKATYLSAHKTREDNQTIVYLHAPIFYDKKLLGYLEATLNITTLLDNQVAKHQISSPFSLSESGRAIYSVLPENIMIHDIKQQSNIPLLGYDWKLMVWPLQQYHFYQYVLYIGILLSIFFSQLFYLVSYNRRVKQELAAYKLHLSAINKDFTASKSRLVQSNKLSSLGEIAAGIAHEINQPLQVICIHAEICQDNLKNKNYIKVDRSFRSIIYQVERIEKIVKQVGSFARNSELDNYTEQAPATIFENVINIVINQYNQDNVELRQILPTSLATISCNKIQIEQVLVNLLINAKDAVEESEEKVVFIKAHNKQDKLYIEVSDTGCGIEISKLTDIFTPFYTTKALGRGTGLGLSISYSIIHQHNGELKVTSEIGKGSTFTVILPLG